MTPRGLISLAMLAVGTLTAGSGVADDVHALRSELMVETAHEVSVEMHRGHASLVVRRTVFNGGPRHDEATFFIDLPDGAVATGLRTLGTQGGQPKWFAGDLMEAEAAAARYRELTGIGGYYPKDPALLSWRNQDLLALQVFPCPPGEAKTIEYTLKVPTRYEYGSHLLTLNRMGSDKLEATLFVRPARATDQVSIAGENVDAKRAVHFPKDAPLEIRLEPPEATGVEGTLAVRGTSKGRFVRRLSLETGRLSKAPEEADVVVLVDASRSVDPNLQLGALAAAHAYLSHLRQANVLLMLFDRSLRRPIGDFRPKKEVMLELGHLPLDRRNGTNVERALAEADRALAARPRGPARRIILFTDALTHSKTTPERLRAAIGTSGAILHIGVLTGQGARLRRDDNHEWGLVARATGGLVWDAGVGADSPEDLIRTYEEWVRPLRLDHVQVEVGNTTLEDTPFSLAEGDGYVGLALDPAGSTRATIRAELWATPTQKSFGVDARASRLWAGLVFGSELLQELDEAEMMPLAMYGGAVSPVTSYLAVEPGVRPSTEGIEYSSGRGSWRSRAPKVRMGATKVAGTGIDKHTWLRARLTTAWQECGGQNTALVSFETTRDEIVLVDEARGLTQNDSVANRCLELFVWNLELPEVFSEPREGWQFFVEA